jgi:hypothetical protein
MAGLMNLGRGVAYRIVSEDLEAIRRDVADHFHGFLTAQDSQGWILVGAGFEVDTFFLPVTVEELVECFFDLRASLG